MNHNGTGYLPRSSVALAALLLADSCQKTVVVGYNIGPINLVGSSNQN